VRDLRPLREENAKLKKIVAELNPDKTMLTDIAKKWRTRHSGARRWSIYAVITASAKGGSVSSS